MSTYSVNVTGFSTSTNEARLHEFFTFCGKINSIDFHDKSADIHFVKPSAAKTALMLNGGDLDGATLTVTSDTDHEGVQVDDQEKHTPPEQSDKPRAGIAAEYLAKGYMLSDDILKHAIEIDNKQGISRSFLSYIQSLDSSIGQRTLGPDQTVSKKMQETATSITNQAKAVDEQKGISKAVRDYYEKALASPFGQRVLAFYTSTSKEVRDIHEEARRIAAQNQDATPPASGSPQPQTTEATPTKA